MPRDEDGGVQIDDIPFAQLIIESANVGPVKRIVHMLLADLSQYSAKQIYPSSMYSPPPFPWIANTLLLRSLSCGRTFSKIYRLQAIARAPRLRGVLQHTIDNDDNNCRLTTLGAWLEFRSLFLYRQQTPNFECNR